MNVSIYLRIPRGWGFEDTELHCWYAGFFDVLDGFARMDNDD